MILRVWGSLKIDFRAFRFPWGGSGFLGFFECVGLFQGGFWRSLPVSGVWALGLCWGLGVLVGAFEVPLRVQGLGM